MKISRTVRLVLALASGAALALAYPLYNLPLLGWIAPALLILAVIGVRTRFGFLLGYLQGAVFHGMTVPWLYTVLHIYGPLPPVVAGLLFAGALLIMSFFYGIFGAVIAWLAKSSPERAFLAAPFAWVAMEFATQRAPALAFPWNLLGYVASGNLAFVQITAVTGILGLSLVVATFNGLVAWVVVQFVARKTEAVKWLAGVTIVLITVALIGPSFIPQTQPPDHIAHLVQTNFPVSLNYPANWMQVHAGEMDQLESISIGAAQKAPGIVVWPEVPAPFSLQDANFDNRAKRIARGAGGGLLVGVIDWKPIGNNQIGASNSAALLGSQGELQFIYDKIHLVPFSEYIPLRKYIFFAQDLTGLVGDFIPGKQYKVGRVPGGPFGVYICYEAIFPNEVRQFTLGGAQVLINISDDGWFGGSGAPAQHLAMARVRAVENRRWLLRDTNDGITASVDPYGRIVARLPASVRGELDAPYAFRSDLTVYTRWGDWLAWLCVLAVVVLVLLVARQRLARKTS